MNKTVEKKNAEKSRERSSGENSTSLFESIESGRTFQDGGDVDVIAEKTLYTPDQVRSMSNDRIKELLEDVADRDLDLSANVELKPIFQKRAAEEREAQEQKKSQGRTQSRL